MNLFGLFLLLFILKWSAGKGLYSDCRVQVSDGASSLYHLSANILRINQKIVQTNCRSQQFNLGVAASCSIQCVRYENLLSPLIIFLCHVKNFLEFFIENHAPDSLKRGLKSVCQIKWSGRF